MVVRHAPWGAAGVEERRRPSAADQAEEVVHARRSSALRPSCARRGGDRRRPRGPAGRSPGTAHRTQGAGHGAAGGQLVRQGRGPDVQFGIVGPVARLRPPRPPAGLGGDHRRPHLLDGRRRALPPRPGAGLRRRRGRHLQCRRLPDRRADHAADPGHLPAQPHRQRSRLGCGAPDRRPARPAGGGGLVRRPGGHVARYPDRHPVGPLGDQLRHVPHHHLRRKRRHGAARRHRPPRSWAHAPTVGPAFGAEPLRFPSGRDRPCVP